VINIPFSAREIPNIMGLRFPFQNIYLGELILGGILPDLGRKVGKESTEAGDRLF
jgi:hypothetical protein